jgi:hypothetical protein
MVNVLQMGCASGAVNDKWKMVALKKKFHARTRRIAKVAKKCPLAG